MVGTRTLEPLYEKYVETRVKGNSTTNVSPTAGDRLNNGFCCVQKKGYEVFLDISLCSWGPLRKHAHAIYRLFQL